MELELSLQCRLLASSGLDILTVRLLVPRNVNRELILLEAITRTSWIVIMMMEKGMIIFTTYVQINSAL
jgi:hypothetical protein